ncbi:hypothetical protein BGZ73_007971 [Actinomortierella ambigua]|nr:hypothetical protein BGZ73_007971 [Actinomortierella ambigua]
MRKKYKTKFPVARIKKIMQLDEDVGKVAQATPVLISKALELFMQSLIDEACVETRAKNAKRLTVAHLKKTILDKDQFDFLRDIVANVADPAESKAAEKGGEGPSSSASSGGAAPTPAATARRGRGTKAAPSASGASGRRRGAGAAAAASAAASSGTNGDVKMADEDEEEEEEEEEEAEAEEDIMEAPKASFAMMESMAGRTKLGMASLGRKSKSARDEDEDDYDA